MRPRTLPTRCLVHTSKCQTLRSYQWNKKFPLHRDSMPAMDLGEVEVKPMPRMRIQNLHSFIKSATPLPPISDAEMGDIRKAALGFYTAMLPENVFVGEDEGFKPEAADE